MKSELPDWTSRTAQAGLGKLTNRGSAGMNVRLFMLVAMTAFFGALWSSDRQYQDTQMASARLARQGAVERGTASVKTHVAPTSCAPPTAAPSIAVPSIIVSSITESSAAEPIRQPVVAPRVAKERPIQIVSFLVSFRRPSFYFEGNRPFDDVSRSEGEYRQGSLETDLASLFRWAGRIRSEIEGETCWMRWQMRRTAFFAQRRMTVLLRQRLDWYAIAEKIARGTMWQLDAVPTNSAARATDEKR